jgi:hypothetical protein
VAVSSAGRPVVAPGHRAWAAPLPREQGNVTAMGDAVTWANTADKRDQGEAGSGVCGGVRESEGERGRAAEGRRHTGPGSTALGGAVQTRFELNPNSNETKMISNSFKL